MPRMQPGPSGAPPPLDELPVLKSGRRAHKMWRVLDYPQHDELARLFAASLVERLPVVTSKVTDNTFAHAWERLSMHCNIGGHREATIFTLRWYLDSVGGTPHDLTTGWLTKNAAESAVRSRAVRDAGWILAVMDDVRPLVDGLDLHDNLHDHYPGWHVQLRKLATV